MPLTDPGTRSSGKLVMMYVGLNAIEHLAGANLLSTADIEDIAVQRVAANSFATALRTCLTNVSYIHSWRLTDPDGTVLYEEAFDPVITGNATAPTGSIAAQSATITATGRGTSNVLANKRGSTRTVVFPSIFVPSLWLEKQIIPSGSEFGGTLITHLDSSNNHGADFYGQKATYKEYVLLQLNAHYQKEFGI